MKAMILAAGRGERLRPLTDDLPKPLVEVGGKPLIQYHLERLAQAGIRSIVINRAYLGWMIEAALGNGAQFGVQIQYSPENPALETGGGIYQALGWLGPGPFLVINGDIWCDLDLAELAIEPDDLAHLVLVDRPPHHPQGDFALQAGRVSNQGEPRLTFAGIGIYRPELFAGCAPGIFPLAPLLRRAADQGKVSGQHHRGRWFDIGTPERLAALNQYLAGSHGPAR